MEKKARRKTVKQTAAQTIELANWVTAHKEQLTERPIPMTKAAVLAGRELRRFVSDSMIKTVSVAIGFAWPRATEKSDRYVSRPETSRRRGEAIRALNEQVLMLLRELGKPVPDLMLAIEDDPEFLGAPRKRQNGELFEPD